VFQYNLNPVFFQIGNVQIRYYGIVYALGLVLVYFLLKYAIKHNKIKNVGLDKLDDLVFYIAIGLLAGARLGYFIFYDIKALFLSPLDIFKIWQGGMSFHGGIIGIAIAVWYFAKKNKARFYEIADMVVLPGALMLFFGRIANFINGELIGTVTNVPWCVNYPGISGCRHPSQLYEALKNLAIFFTLFAILGRKLQAGIRFWLFVTMYGLLRFIMTFWREDPRFLGISEGQYLSLAMFIIGSIYLYKLTRSQR